MAGMDRDSLVADLKASLHDSAAVFRSPYDGDFDRFLGAALLDMQVKRPRTRMGAVMLVAGVNRYAVVEPDFVALKTDAWRDTARLPKPWAEGFPGALPRFSCSAYAQGAWIDLDPAPTAEMLTAMGAECRFWYFAKHQIGKTDAECTVREIDRPLLLLRAQAEAMREAAARNVTKPVQLRDGLSGTPRNSTPIALYKDLLAAFWSAR